MINNSFKDWAVKREQIQLEEWVMDELDSVIKFANVNDLVINENMDIQEIAGAGIAEMGVGTKALQDRLTKALQAMKYIKNPRMAQQIITDFTNRAMETLSSGSQASVRRNLRTSLMGKPAPPETAAGPPPPRNMGSY